MQVLPIPAFYDNYIWLIINEQQAICVDPGEASPLLHFLKKEQLNLKAILLTHHHHDHIGGTQDLVESLPKLSVYGPQDGRIPHLTHSLEEGDVLKIAGCEFQILATAGHTSSHISYYEAQKAWLFCGDTLFSAGCGRVFDGTIEELHKSLQRLKNLPEQTKVFSAHEYTEKNLNFAAMVEPKNPDISHYIQLLQKEKSPCSLPSTIALEKQINPFFRTQVPEVQAFAKVRELRGAILYPCFSNFGRKKISFRKSGQYLIKSIDKWSNAS